MKLEEETKKKPTNVTTVPQSFQMVSSQFYYAQRTQ